MKWSGCRNEYSVHPQPCYLRLRVEMCHYQKRLDFRFKKVRVRSPNRLVHYRTSEIRQLTTPLLVT